MRNRKALSANSCAPLPLLFSSMKSAAILVAARRHNFNAMTAETSAPSARQTRSRHPPSAIA